MCTSLNGKITTSRDLLSILLHCQQKASFLHTTIIVCFVQKKMWILCRLFGFGSIDWNKWIIALVACAAINWVHKFNRLQEYKMKLWRTEIVEFIGDFSRNFKKFSSEIETLEVNFSSVWKSNWFMWKGKKKAVRKLIARTESLRVGMFFIVQ